MQRLVHVETEHRANPYLHSLGISGGEADGTAVMEGGQATVVLPYITLLSKEYSRLPELCNRPISRPIVYPDTPCPHS